MQFIKVNLAPRGPLQPVADVVHGRHRKRGQETYRLNDEYDPLMPNEYEKVRREFEERARKPVAKVPLIIEKRDYPKLSADEAHQRRLKLLEEEEKRQQGGETHPKTEESKDIGLKIMQKLGWKEGKGLGANEQGIIAPLVAKPTGKNVGVIVEDNRRMHVKKPSTSGFGQSPPGSHISREQAVMPIAVDSERECCTIKILCHGCKATEEQVSESFEEILCEFGTIVNLKVIPPSADNNTYAILCEYEDPSQAKAALGSMPRAAPGFKTTSELVFPEEAQ